jgi:DNA polymerase/3'-5' exonuclease PolX
LSSTKDLPYAHFDAERFLKSNERVINFTSDIYKNLQNKKYQEAKELTGQILHTIQDFYSHSNWVEMGNTKINTPIGTDKFSSLAIVDPSQNVTCFNNW